MSPPTNGPSTRFVGGWSMVTVATPCSTTTWSGPYVPSMVVSRGGSTERLELGGDVGTGRGVDHLGDADGFGVLEP